MLKIFTILFVFSVCNPVYGHTSKATHAQKKLNIYNEIYGSDALLQTMFENVSESQIPAQFFPQIQSLTDPYYPKFQTGFENELSTFLQVIQMGDRKTIESVIQKADSSVAKEWKQSPYAQFLQRTKNSLQLKDDINKLDAQSRLTQSITAGFDQLPMGNLIEQPFSQSTFDSFQKNWSKKESLERYYFLSQLEDYIFYKAMFNIQQQSAYVSMFLNQDPDRAKWKKNIASDLKKKFCSRPPKSNDFFKDTMPLDIDQTFTQRCYWMSELAVDSIREWMTLDEALDRISKSLAITNGHLSKLRSYVMNNGSVTDESALYLQYVSSYSITAASPAGKAILVSPMADTVRRLFNLNQINTQAYDVSHVVPYYNYGDPVQDQEWVKLFKDSMKNLSISLNESYLRLVEIYEKHPRNVSEHSAPFLIQNQQEDIRDMIQNYPKAIGQVISDRPELRWYFITQAKLIKKNNEAKETLHKAATFGIIAVGIMLMALGVGEILLAEGIISLTVSAKVAAVVGLLELGLAIGDVGMSLEYKSMKRAEYKTAKASLIAGNTNDVQGARKLFEQLEEANVARAWAVGGAVFQIPQIVRAVKIFNTTGSAQQAISGASSLASYTVSNKTPQPLLLPMGKPVDIPSNTNPVTTPTSVVEQPLSDSFVDPLGVFLPSRSLKRILKAPLRRENLFGPNQISYDESLKIIPADNDYYQNDDFFIWVSESNESGKNFLTIVDKKNHPEIKDFNDKNTKVYSILDQLDPKLDSDQNIFLIQKNGRLYQITTWPSHAVEFDPIPFISPEFTTGVRWSKYNDSLIQWRSSSEYTVAIRDDGTWIGVFETSNFDQHIKNYLQRGSVKTSEEFTDELIGGSILLGGQQVQGIDEIEFVKNIGKSKRISIIDHSDGMYIDLDESTYLVLKDGTVIPGKVVFGKTHYVSEKTYKRDIVSWSHPENFLYQIHVERFKTNGPNERLESFVFPIYDKDFPDGNVFNLSEKDSPLNVWYMDHWLNGGGNDFTLIFDIEKISLDKNGKLIESPFTSDEIFSFYKTVQQKPIHVPAEALIKLDDLPELGTAIVKIEPTQKPWQLTFVNVRKENGVLVFYNMDTMRITRDSNYYFPQVDESNVFDVKNNYEVYITTVFHENIGTRERYKDYWRQLDLPNSIDRILPPNNSMH